MEMHYFWILNGGLQKLFDFLYHPGIKNLADYPSKHHMGTHHIRVHPYYVHTPNLPRYLIRAAKPSVWQGSANMNKDTFDINWYPLVMLICVTNLQL